MSYSAGEVRGILRCYTALTPSQLGGDYHVRRIDLQRSFAKLSQRVKQVLYLVGVCDYDVRQAAAELEMGKDTVQAIWTGGIKDLTRYMNRGRR